MAGAGSAEMTGDINVEVIPGLGLDVEQRDSVLPKPTTEQMFEMCRQRHDPDPEPDPYMEKLARGVGIHSLEVYTPRHAASAKSLEEEHGVSGKYTNGLLMSAFCGPDHDEDPVSFAMSALSRLIWRNGLKHKDIGMVQVGSESLIDRAKSIKSNLMALFEEYECYNVEGTDQYNACYGGTAALLNCFNWMQSLNWDGRWAIAIPTDIADAPPQYRFMVGSAAVAVLVGPDAPLKLERERVTHILDRWDFYKPIGWDVMAPIVDGPYSIEVYFTCLDACSRQLKERVGYGNPIEDHEFIVFHLGSGPKFVKHAFERLCYLSYATDEASRSLETRTQEGERTSKEKLADLPKNVTEHIFASKVCPSLHLAARIGPMHTAAAYTNMTSLMIDKKEDLIGKKILVYSYGSGAASTQYRLRVTSLPVINWNKHLELDQRRFCNAKTFDTLCSRYANTYAKFGWKADVDDAQYPAAFYLTECDSMGRRAYHQIADPNKVVYPLGPISIPIPEDKPLTEEQQKLMDELYPKTDWVPLPPEPPPAPAPPPAAAAAPAGIPDMSNMGADTQQALVGLLALLQQQQQ